MFRFIRIAVTAFIDLLFPSLCLGCNCMLGNQEEILCPACRFNLPETGLHRHPDDKNLLNKFAGKVPVSFVASFVYFSKGSVVQKIIHQIKYKGQKGAAKAIGTWYGHQLKTESKLLDETDVLIGVPLHVRRFQQRGYNQADCIAEGLSEALKIPFYTDVLTRTHFKTSQTHKNRLERWRNVEAVFSVIDRTKILNKNVVIVDDVLTTGATLEACAVELLQAGCKSIGIITLATTGRY